MAIRQLGIPHGGGTTMEKLIQYFIQQSDRNFSEFREELKHVNGQLNDLQKFKAEMMTSSKWISIIISSAGSAITLIVNLLINYYAK
jgi:hypothetical protein